MDENAATVALENVRTCDRILAYLTFQRAEAIAQAVAAGLPEDQLAERLGMSAEAVRDALQAEDGP